MSESESKRLHWTECPSHAFWNQKQESACKGVLCVTNTCSASGLLTCLGCSWSRASKKSCDVSRWHDLLAHRCPPDTGIRRRHKDALFRKEAAASRSLLRPMCDREDRVKSPPPSRAPAVTHWREKQRAREREKQFVLHASWVSRVISSQVLSAHESLAWISDACKANQVPHPCWRSSPFCSSLSLEAELLSLHLLPESLL